MEGSGCSDMCDSLGGGAGARCGAGTGAGTGICKGAGPGIGTSGGGAASQDILSASERIQTQRCKCAFTQARTLILRAYDQLGCWVHFAIYIETQVVTIQAFQETKAVAIKCRCRELDGTCIQLLWDIFLNPSLVPYSCHLRTWC